MVMDKDLIYCKHILEAIKSVEDFTKGMTFDTFAADARTFMAVTRGLEIIGEAAKQLSDDFRTKNYSIPWRDIMGMRDVLIHH